MQTIFLVFYQKYSSILPVWFRGHNIQQNDNSYQKVMQDILVTLFHLAVNI